MYFFRRQKSASENQSQAQYTSTYNNKEMMQSINGTITNVNSVCMKSVKAVSEIATNMVYKAKHSNLPILQRKPIQLTKFSDSVVLLGKKYDYENEKQFISKFQQIVWFSYRSYLEGRISDAGWGCMIRVCQMLLAEALKQTHPKFHISEIITEFSEEESCLFSFDHICQIGNIKQRWTSSTEILSILKKILEEQTKFHLSIEIYSCAVSIDDIQQKGLKYPMIVCVNNRIGENSIPKQYHDNFLALMDHPKSIGVIGGVGGQAVYIVGYQGLNMIVLDPHYIQGQGNGEIIHFQRVPRSLNIQKIVPSVAFCFLLRNKAEHTQWIKDMAEISYFYHPFTGIEFDRELSKKIYEQKHPPHVSSDEDQFQILQ